MEFTAKDVAKLREETGAGFADCKNALTTAKNFDDAIKLIEEKGQQRAEKVKGQDRETRQGLVEWKALCRSAIAFFQFFETAGGFQCEPQVMIGLPERGHELDRPLAVLDRLLRAPQHSRTRQ